MISAKNRQHNQNPICRNKKRYFFTIYFLMIWYKVSLSLPLKKIHSANSIFLSANRKVSSLCDFQIYIVHSQIVNQLPYNFSDNPTFPPIHIHNLPLLHSSVYMEYGIFKVPYSPSNFSSVRQMLKDGPIMNDHFSDSVC